MNAKFPLIVLGMFSQKSEKLSQEHMYRDLKLLVADLLFFYGVTFGFGSRISYPGLQIKVGKTVTCKPKRASIFPGILCSCFGAYLGYLPAFRRYPLHQNDTQHYLNNIVNNKSLLYRLIIC